MLNLKLFTSAESHLYIPTCFWFCAMTPSYLYVLGMSRHHSRYTHGMAKTPNQKDIEWICRICRRSPFWADFSQSHAGDAVVPLFSPETCSDSHRSSAFRRSWCLGAHPISRDELMVVLNSHALPSHDVHMDYGDYGDYGLLFAIKAKFVQSAVFQSLYHSIQSCLKNGNMSLWTNHQQTGAPDSWVMPWLCPQESCTTCDGDGVKSDGRVYISSVCEYVCGTYVYCVNIYISVYMYVVWIYIYIQSVYI